ncbi:MAG: DUF1553 domain-containing protein [Planctomycetaceae bacterium]|nr:DUF1553 domain-containing protein [Planctomycetaceae bacterium]
MLFRWTILSSFRSLAALGGRLSLLSLSAVVVWTTAVRADVQFNRDIRPILSDNCFACHGPDAGHREADLRLDIREAALASGAFVPGDASASELVRRILTSDPDAIMPPPHSNKELTEQQKQILQQWVAEGAIYQKHWSFEPPVKPTVPPGVSAIDVLVQRRLESLGLHPSPTADRRVLIRRLYSDLIGLLPTPEAVQAFINDSSPNACEKVVDELLANPHFGERMAISWLDVVRFADTIGYHSDNPRNVWPYRNWVIDSFNNNKPFDRFTIEQIAGDLLPDASQETRVGSGFNRLLLSTEEGGAQPKDYEARMLTDRVRAIGTVWLGMTTGCAQCHDHKFDPFTMRDFYSLGAFFADIQEPILGRREPGMLVTTAEQEARRAELQADLQKAGEAFAKVEPQLEIAQSQWEHDVSAYKITLPELVKDAKVSAADSKTAKQVSDAITKEASQRSAAEKDAIRNYFRNKVTVLFPDERQQLAAAKQAFDAYENSLPRCLVSVSTSNKRTVRLLPRGNWMDETGEVMQPALPAFLVPSPPDKALTRLDLANWVVSRDNPLTARTVMNRLWKQFFGAGISRVLDDLGAQGEPPVNAELLDWLACEFMDSGWDLKHMVRTIVTSKTYQQTSVATPELLAADPQNRELARQSAFRYEAELIRDNALSVSGLLVKQIGGPSVKPYQPEGYWENLNFPTRTYDASQGPDQYRRGIYTWWQRSFVHPGMLAFDAPSREECCAERGRSNIPQQALVLLNDPTFVEAARALAARILRDCSGSAEDRIRWAWQQTLQRDPETVELSSLLSLLKTQQAAYSKAPEQATALLSVGQSAGPEDLNPAELAAWTHVARVLLNLHETVTRS